MINEVLKRVKKLRRKAREQSIEPSVLAEAIALLHQHDAERWQPATQGVYIDLLKTLFSNEGLSSTKAQAAARELYVWGYQPNSILGKDQMRQRLLAASPGLKDEEADMIVEEGAPTVAHHEPMTLIQALAIAKEARHG